MTLMVVVTMIVFQIADFWEIVFLPVIKLRLLKTFMATQYWLRLTSISEKEESNRPEQT